MDASDIRIAAIMPTYNQAKYIDEAIDSIVDQVDQLIVVDDGCRDGTADILEARGFAGTTHAENEGIASAINTGFRLLRDDITWVGWVSSDNVYSPRWRESMLPYAVGSAGAVYSNFTHGKRPAGMPYKPGRLIGQEACYFGPSFIIRRDVWEATGEHRGKISHDYDHWSRVEETCWDAGLDIVYNPEVLCNYRLHSERVCIVRRHQYDAPHWRSEAQKRRAV